MTKQLKRLQKYQETEGKRWKPFHNKYRGRCCFILGNGPSLNKQDLRLLANEFTMVTNYFIRHEHFSIIDPDLYCVCAEQIFGSKTRIWLSPESMHFSPLIYELWHSKPNSSTWVFPYYYKPGIEEQKLFPADRILYVFWETPWKLVQDVKHMNFDIAVEPLHNARTTIINVCVPLAYYLGFEEVYLLGCDCDYGMKTHLDCPIHFYGRESIMERTPFEFERTQKLWAPRGPVMQSYAIAKKRFEQDGRTIYNATEGGKLEIFPKVRLKDIL